MSRPRCVSENIQKTHANFCVGVCIRAYCCMKLLSLSLSLHTYMYRHTYAYTCTHYVCTHVCTYVRTYVRTYVCVCTSSYMHIYIYIYVCVCVHACVCVNMCICMHIHVYMSCDEYYAWQGHMNGGHGDPYSILSVVQLMSIYRSHILYGFTRNIDSSISTIYIFVRIYIYIYMCMHMYIYIDMVPWHTCISVHTCTHMCM